MSFDWTQSSDFQQLVNHLCLLADKKPESESHQRWLIGIVGIPCSGKSVIAKALRDAVNEKYYQLHKSDNSICEYIGMDGYHYPRSFLSNNFDYPEIAHAKRGAYWTFDVFGFSKLLHNIVTLPSNEKNYILAPTFDHGLKDPSNDEKQATKIYNYHKIVIVEGLYLFLTKHPVWNKLVFPLFNQRWYLQCDFALAQKRIVKRHVQSGICQNEKDALFRWLDNDKPNGQILMDNLPSKDHLNIVMQATDPHGIKIIHQNFNLRDQNQGTVCPHLQQIIAKNQTQFVKVPSLVTKQYFAPKNVAKL